MPRYLLNKRTYAVICIHTCAYSHYLCLALLHTFSLYLTMYFPSSLHLDLSLPSLAHHSLENKPSSIFSCSSLLSKRKVPSCRDSCTNRISSILPDCNLCSTICPSSQLTEDLIRIISFFSSCNNTSGCREIWGRGLPMAWTCISNTIYVRFPPQALLKLQHWTY